MLSKSCDVLEAWLFLNDGQAVPTYSVYRLPYICQDIAGQRTSHFDVKCWQREVSCDNMTRRYFALVVNLWHSCWWHVPLKFSIVAHRSTIVLDTSTFERIMSSFAMWYWAYVRVVFQCVFLWNSSSLSRVCNLTVFVLFSSELLQFYLKSYPYFFNSFFFTAFKNPYNFNMLFYILVVIVTINSREYLQQFAA